MGSDFKDNGIVIYWLVNARAGFGGEPSSL
jgi:hypothetical protein